MLLNAGCRTFSPQSVATVGALSIPSSPELKPVVEASEQYRLQILISEVVNGSSGPPTLRRKGYRLGAEYFYPASTVKLCGAVAALQVCEELEANGAGVDLLDVPFAIEPLFDGDAGQLKDPSNRRGGVLTLGHCIRRIALVSDNEAFNHLFDVVGHERLNWSMHAAGLRSTVINHRLSESRRLPNPTDSAAVTWQLPDGRTLQVPARRSHLHLTNRPSGTHIGNAYMNAGARVESPLDFTARNGIDLLDLQDLLIQVVRPDVAIGKPGIKLSPSHRAFLVEAMTEYPRESINPVYLAQTYPDDYCKFLLPGVRRVFPDKEGARRIQVTGKIGRAYGFTIENAYLANPMNGRAVFVSAVLYTNSDGVLNDDAYEYLTVADPFMAGLGEYVARTSLSDTSRTGGSIPRARQKSPALKAFEPGPVARMGSASEGLP